MIISSTQPTLTRFKIVASAIAGHTGWSTTMVHQPAEQEFAQPPVNVRIEHNDGTHTPVECVYAGSKNGTHHWNTIREVILRSGDRKAWDEMPVDTEVHLYVRGVKE